MVQALTDRRQRVRWEAAKALGQINNPAGAQALVKTLEDRDFDVRWLAAEALIALGSEAAVPLLEALIKRSKSPVLREGAHHILNHVIGGDTAIEHHAVSHPRVTPQLKEVLQPVVSALVGTMPDVERLPLLAEKALEELPKSRSK